jgi:hypothetical protein
MPCKHSNKKASVRAQRRSRWGQVLGFDRTSPGVYALMTLQTPAEVYAGDMLLDLATVAYAALKHTHSQLLHMEALYRLNIEVVQVVDLICSTSTTLQDHGH